MPETWRTITDISKDVFNPGEALARHANKEGLAGRALYSDERQEKMEEGTEAHKVLELLGDGKKPDPKDYGFGVRGYAEGFLNWHKRFKRRILMTEVEVRAAKPKIKGRIDLVRACQKPGCECDGKGVVIADGKAGKLVTFFSAHLQVAGYHYIWLYEERPEPVCGREILCVNAAGDFKVWKGLATPEQFLAAAIWHEDLVPLRAAVEEQRDRK